MWLRNEYEKTIAKPWETVSSPIKYIGRVPAFIATHENYRFGIIFAAACSGNLDQFDTVTATLAAHYEHYRIVHPIKARVAKLAVQSGVPRAFACAMAAISY